MTSAFEGGARETSTVFPEVAAASTQTGDEDGLREIARNIFKAGCEAVAPSKAISNAIHVMPDGKSMKVSERVVPLSEFDNIFVIAAGKAAVGMAEGIVAKVGAERISEGVVITKYGHSRGHRLPSAQFQVHEAGHPSPDQNSVQGTQAVLKLASKASENDLVIVCLSGGGSALLCSPVDGVSLAEMQAATKALLACGCSIDDKNAILKHLSLVKGGQLRRQIHPGQCVSFILSDVVGDPLDVIASGPTVPDTSTMEECKRIMARFGLEKRFPASCNEHLIASSALSSSSVSRETPKSGDLMFKYDVVEVVGSNSLAVRACAEKAREYGFEPLVLGSYIEGDALAVGTAMGGILKSVAEEELPRKRPVAIIGGGETTMTLPPNPGLGGRNQALALSAMRTIRGLSKVAFLAAGTDGGDGPKHDAAGAVVTGSDFKLAAEHGLDYEDAITSANSYGFFKDLEKSLYAGRENVMHLRDGPTGTNVMDLIIMLAA
eukprot:jgi/Bigna1/88473/estExt_fgenesh1_pg.C_320111